MQARSAREVRRGLRTGDVFVGARGARRRSSAAFTLIERVGFASLAFRAQQRIVRARYFAWKRRLAQLFAAGYDLDRLPSCLPRVEGAAE